MRNPSLRLLALLALAHPEGFAQSEPAFTLTIDASALGKAISPDLVGVFFEDLSYAADGGLYAELVQNRSFEYSQLDRADWNHLTAWEVAERGGKGGLSLDGSAPLNPNNPHYGVVQIGQVGEVALINSGFDGIAVRAGESYDLALFARRLYTGGTWDRRKSDRPLPLVARLESKDGAILAETELAVSALAWERYTATLSPTASDDKARLVLVARDRGGLALDEVSLFPRNTFKNRPNGLRADLAQAIADLKPKFMRFPGGCLVHGNGVPNLYHWKHTIGPIEQRRHQRNIWKYHQSVGLGYFEYFKFCEDIGAKPLPVVAAGVSCQNSSHMGGTGQGCIPLADMPGYIQDILDLVEWANGPADSKWGSIRAAAGHPEPFGLKYLGVGNEDHITPEFEQRFRMIHDALKTKHPEIVIIGTVGPFSDGEDYERGWKFANQLGLPMVDEHYYQPTRWFWDNLQRYDAYDRTKSKVYLGEYAAKDAKNRSTLRAALAEAAYLTALERNGDIVRFASYAPMLAKHGHVHWSPNLIYFNNSQVFPTLSYEVQKLFSHNAGDHWVESSLVALNESAGSGLPRDLAWSTVRDSASGDIILKIVNGASVARVLRLDLRGFAKLPSTASRIVLTGADPDVTRPEDARPETRAVPVSSSFDQTLPPDSLTLLRVKTR